MKTIYRDQNENRIDEASIDWLKVQATVTYIDCVNGIRHVKVLRWDDVFQGQVPRTTVAAQQYQHSWPEGVLKYNQALR